LVVKTRPNAIAWLPAVGLIACVPFYVVGFSSDNKWVALICICIGAGIKYGYLASQYTIGQGVVGARTRATATAILPASTSVDTTCPASVSGLPVSGSAMAARTRVTAERSGVVMVGSRPGGLHRLAASGLAGRLLKCMGHPLPGGRCRDL
jgi:hypothetical protein